MSTPLFILGPGQCGFQSIISVINQQPGWRLANGDGPLLAWIPDRPILRQRLERLERQCGKPGWGDASSSYLPHVEEIIENVPEAKFLILDGPGVANRFERHLNEHWPIRLNLWSEADTQDLQLNRLYPQYGTLPRLDALDRYLADYAEKGTELAVKYPQHVLRLNPADVLGKEEVLRQVLSFIGLTPKKQVISKTIPQELRDPPPKRSRPPAPKPGPNAMDPRRCVVLVPYNTHIHPPCEEALKALEHRGYPVRRVAGFAAIDQARNQLASDALIDGFEETLWVDSDVGFDPNDVDRLRQHRLPITCGIYAQKGRRMAASHFLPGTKKVVFGEGGGLTEILYAATGFLHVRREVYLTMQRQLKLPICNEAFASPVVPYFQPSVQTSEDGAWYLAEDYAFSQKARACGYPVKADTRIRLWHYGNFGYGWEETGRSPDRMATFTLNLNW